MTEKYTIKAWPWRTKFRSGVDVIRDSAGELGISEWDDEEAELGNDFESVWPDLGPDLANHVRNTRRAMYWVTGCLSFVIGGLVALLVKALT